MLSLGPGSTCDVCLELFGLELKAPCAIQCGHVFCVDCLNHITRPQCPLCRVPFDSRLSIRLHVDLDNVSKESPKNKSSSIAEQEAKKLHEAIVKVANEGSGELQARQLIGDCKTFLANHSRDMFIELRVAHRMLEYLCDVKSRLLSQTYEVTVLQEELSRLKEEKSGLQARIRDVLENQKFERETAYAVESSLREHCARSHEAYVTVVEQYNFVVSEWIRLREEIQHLRSPSMLPLDPTPRDRSNMDMQLDETKTPQPCSIPSLDQDRLKGAALRIADTYLISPLPELTTFVDRPIALPTEKEIAAASYVQEKLKDMHPVEPDNASTRMPTEECGKAGHPYTCDCEDINIFSPDQKKPDIRRSSFDTEPVATPADVKAKVSSTPSTNLYSIPSTPARGRSYTMPSHNSRAPSRAASRSSSPTGNVPASHSQTPTNPPPREIYSPGSGHTTFPQSRESESVRSRLHDLLQDNTSASACSTPAPVPPMPYGTAIMSSGLSRASSAALALEKERKERKKAEKEQRKLEKERQRSEQQEAPPRPTSTSTINSGVYNRSMSSYTRESSSPYPTHSSQLQRHKSTNAKGSYANVPGLRT